MTQQLEARVERINQNNKEELAPIYKEVFMGHPWHEDLICENSLKEKNDPLHCMTQYTKSECDKFDKDRRKESIENDCRDKYCRRKNSIILLNKEGLEKCVGCGDDLRLISFYPSFANHEKLIEEAVNEPGFIGFILKRKESEKEKVIGFSWGYKMHPTHTVTVDFMPAIENLRNKGLNIEKVFYGSEIGVVQRFQGHGYGSAISAIRLKEAYNQGYETFITRTINPFVLSILGKIFSDEKGEELYKDPERGSTWFKWEFKYFDKESVEKMIERSNIIHE
ncbi:MAG: hypothetical protein AABW82_02985 [Nanoarchaeota archaeon]